MAFSALGSSAAAGARCAVATLAFFTLGCGDAGEFTFDLPCASISCTPIHPPEPGATHPGHGPTVVFAVTKFFLGDTDRKGDQDRTNGWRQFGFDIDGTVDACPSHHCKPAAGSTPAIAFPDGDCGVDNSFGLNLLPIVLGTQGDASTQLDDSLRAGDLTLLVAIDGLSQESDQNPLPARFYRGAHLGHPPQLDGQDDWPVEAASLENPQDLASSRFPFPASWVTGNVWVSGLGDVDVYLGRFLGQPLHLPLHHAVVSMELGPARREASNGTISGVADVNDMRALVRNLGGAADPSLCLGSTIESIITGVTQAADIMLDGTAGTPDETCNGISVGLGFDAQRVQLGEIVSEPDPPAACP